MNINGEEACQLISGMSYNRYLTNVKSPLQIPPKISPQNTKQIASPSLHQGY